MQNLEDYKTRFGKLNVSRSNGLTAPHKPILLLSVIELFEDGHLTDRHVYPDQMLELTFKRMWEQYVPADSRYKCSFSYPFYHMENEGFWSLAKTDAYVKLKEYSSVSSIRKNFKYAILDKELVSFFKSKDSRVDLKEVLIRTYLSKPVMSDDGSEIDMSHEMSRIGIEYVVTYLQSLDKKIESQQKVIKRNTRTNNSSSREIDLLKKELDEKDKSIELLKKKVNELNDTIDSLVTSNKQKNHEIALLKVQLKLAQSPSVIHSDLDSFPFLEKVNVKDIPESPSNYRSIKYVYSPSDEVYYRIDSSRLHEDEHLLSKLRVRLYEQLTSTPEVPLLRCTCCKRPVYLAGNSGIKGEIIGFRHLGEGRIITGEHIGDATSAPKQENQDELESLKTLFMCYSDLLDDLKEHDSFMLLPGANRHYPGDITFKYNGRSIAVIFSSASHPLDFIVRRNRFAYEHGYLPLWILSPSHFISEVMSNRDVSAFINGYLCTIDNDAVNLFKETGEMTLSVREYHKREYAFLPLSTIIEDTEKTIKTLVNTPLWNKDQESKIQKSITTAIDSHETDKDSKSIVVNTQQKREPKYSKSIVSQLSEDRYHLVGSLYAVKLGIRYGIIDEKTNKYLVVPTYTDIRISNDLTEAELIDYNGFVEKVIRLQDKNVKSSSSYYVYISCFVKFIKHANSSKLNSVSTVGFLIEYDGERYASHRVTEYESITDRLLLMEVIEALNTIPHGANVVIVSNDEYLGVLCKKTVSDTTNSDLISQFREASEKQSSVSIDIVSVEDYDQLSKVQKWVKSSTKASRKRSQE